MSRWISFDAYRTMHMDEVHYIKPEQLHQHFDQVRSAEWLLFPEYWQLNSLLYGLKARIFPSPASYHLGHDKVEMTRALQLLVPYNVPETWIAANTPEQRERLWDEMLLPFVAKIPRSSEGRGVFLIEDRAAFNRYCEIAPVLYLQEYLPIDRDMRLVVIGDEVVTGYWRRGGDNFHNNIAQGGELIFGDLHPAGVELVTQMARQLGVDHAGFDVAMVGDHPYILEFNRLFGNQGLVEQGFDVSASIMAYLNRQSAIQQAQQAVIEGEDGDSELVVTCDDVGAVVSGIDSVDRLLEDETAAPLREAAAGDTIAAATTDAV